MDTYLTQSNKYESMIQEMGQQNFEVIRFASYRTACKLRFIQKRTNFYLVDLWNTIEAIRENGLHVYQDPMAEISYGKLESFVASIYYQLNKRLPSSQHINIDESIASLLAFLSTTYDPNNIGKVRAFAVKIALSTLCSGNIVDKLKYVYSLISDPMNGHVIVNRFMAYLRDLMALTNSVFESSSFQYDENLPSTLFDFSHPVDIETFMDLFLSSNGPPSCLSWFFIYHKMAEVEFVVHYTQCDACHRTNFTGFRYKCQKCFNYNLCQDCFWRGRSSGSHNSDTHLCKECTFWKTPSKRIGHSLRKSFRCIPSNKKIQFSDEFAISRRINLSHIVPPSPATHRNGYPGGPHDFPIDDDSIYDRESTLNRSYHGILGYSLDNTNEEHRLIARYAAKLANHERDESVQAVDEESKILTDIAQQQQVISQLEAKNREIMREISRLRQDHGAGLTDTYQSHSRDAALLNELNALRARQEELENHLTTLSESRKELTLQLERLVQFLRNQGATVSNPSSATSSLNRGSHLSGYSLTNFEQSDFESLNSRDATMNRDLLEAADSVSNAMCSMVNSLHLDDDKSINESLSFAKNLENHLRLKDNPIKYSSETEDEGPKMVPRRYHPRTRDVRSKRRPKERHRFETTDDEDIYAKTSEDDLDEETEDEILDRPKEVLSDAWFDRFLAKK